MIKTKCDVILYFVFVIMGNQINIEEELSAIWQRIYVDIVHYVLTQGLKNQEIKLNNCLIKSLFVDIDNILLLTDYNGNTNFAENYEDPVLYEVYNTLILSKK